MKKLAGFQYYLTIGMLFFNLPLHASFIEQTLGTAVVKDATAVYFNPASLTSLSNQQFIVQGTLAKSAFQFTGNAQKINLGINESGSTQTQSNFYLPSLYFSIPINERFTGGFAIVANDFNRDLDNHSILRYSQSHNQTDDLDFVPALGMKINEFLAIGGNINLSHAHMIQKPVLNGIPRLNIPESQGLNNTKGSSIGGDVGILIKPAAKTMMGFNYRSAMTYHLQGSSKISGLMPVYSDNYHFKYWTPARSVFSISHFFNDQAGFIATIQYLQWNIFKESHAYNFATQSGMHTLIIPQTTIRYDFHNSWMFTLGTLYNISKKWTVRLAGTYSQSPSNGKFQIATGDSFVTGFSMGYRLMNNLTIDGSYGHAFFKKAAINIHNTQNIITGTNEGQHDSVSLKLTFDIV